MFEIFKLFNRDPLGSITPEQLKEVLQSIESKYNALQEENLDLGTKLRDSLTQIAHLEEEKNEQKAKLESLKEEKKQLDQALEELHAQDQSLELTQRIQTLEEEKQQLDQALQELRAQDQSQAFQEQIQTLEAEKTQREQALQELQARLEALEAEKQQLDQALQELRAQNPAELQQRIQTLEEERNQLLAKIPEQEALLATIDDQSRALEERLIELSKTVEALEQQEAIPDPALLQTIEEQRAKIILFEEEIQKLANSFESQADLRAEIERLTTENAQQKAELEELQANKKKRGKTGRLQALETEKDLLEEHVRELEQRMPDFDQVATSLKEKEGVLQALQENLIEHQDRLEQVSLENERLLHDNQQLEANLADAEARSEADRSLIRDLENEIGRLMAEPALERRIPQATPAKKPQPKPQPKATADRQDRRAMLAKMIRR